MKQLERVVSEIETSPGIVLYTLVDREIRERLKTRCQELGVPFLSVMAPVVRLFQSYLGGEPTRGWAASIRWMRAISSASTPSTTPSCTMTGT